MVDAEDCLLAEGGEQRAVESLRRGEVAAEGFFDDDSSALAASRPGQLFHHGPEQRRWDGEVMGGALGWAELFAKGLEGRRVPVVAVDIPQQAAQLLERCGI